MQQYFITLLLKIGVAASIWHRFNSVVMSLSPAHREAATISSARGLSAPVRTSVTRNSSSTPRVSATVQIPSGRPPLRWMRGNQP